MASVPDNPRRNPERVNSPRPVLSWEVSTTNEDVAEYVRKQLSQWDFEDVTRAAKGGCKLGAFILASCLMDHLAYFYSPIGSEHEKSGPRFRSFVSNYLKSYDSRKLYKDLRCHLVHNYTEGGSYLFTDGRPEVHLRPDSNSGRLIVNLEDFLADIRGAMVRLFDDAKRGDTANDESGKAVSILDNIVRRFSKTGICGSVTAACASAGGRTRSAD